MHTERRLKIRAGCRFSFVSAGPTPAVFLVRPETTLAVSQIAEAWSSSPVQPWHDYADAYANACRRLTLPDGRLELTYDTVLLCPDELDPVDLGARRHSVADLPDDALMFTLPSRFCLSDVLANRAFELFGSVAPGWPMVQAICDWVNGYLRFSYGTSTATTTAVDVLEAGVGVCRDFAHLAIAFCRAMSVPARYAFGYLPDIDVPPPDAPMDFCAWFEAYLGGRWWTFDPRNNQRRRGRVTIARGRDALDVAMVTTYGSTILENMTVWADEVRDAESGT